MLTTIMLLRILDSINEVIGKLVSLFAIAFTGVFNITGGLSAVQEIMRSLDMAP
ncbi:hypothetical protein [Pelistega suis]|uniref:hypothetical protein n=1 Tax=Pelistega suis TaxID=1631957 RepID=UPI00211CDA5B|nr:hypothetical protein [Pelistega suis]MCQ9329513.1 hypothetical protein [Pelistega suis]